MRALLSALAVAAFVVAVSAQQPVGRPKPVDRTTAIQARMTPAQRANGRAHAKSLTLFRMTRLLDQLTSAGMHYDSVIEEATASAATLLGQAACRSSIAVRGRVLSEQSFPIEDGTFLFTDYDVAVLAVYRAPSALSSVAKITVTQPGGAMIIEGVTVRASINVYPPLSVGAEYVILGPLVDGSGAVVNEQFLTRQGENFVFTNFRPATDVNVERTGLGADVVEKILSTLRCQ
ncbi:MAG TPA: hypothetical protein VFV98_12745 [Vicinamibacterales bacterium]|nr:hypothetical protein [Vicinamibacterales bacterium]